MQDFPARLLQAATRPDITKNPFVKGIAAGQVSRLALQAYAQDLTFLAKTIPTVLARLLSLCDHEATQRLLLENILEETGAVSLNARDGLIFDPARSHLTLALRFLRALGVEPDGHTHTHGRWFETRLAQDHWLGPFAYVTAGFEFNVPRAYRILVKGLHQHYGFTREELEFFTEHCTADDRHGASGGALLASAATTDELQEEALEGAHRGALAWWHIHQRHALKANLANASGS